MSCSHEISMNTSTAFTNRIIVYQVEGCVFAKVKGLCDLVILILIFDHHRSRYVDDTWALAVHSPRGPGSLTF